MKEDIKQLAEMMDLCRDMCTKILLKCLDDPMLTEEQRQQILDSIDASKDRTIQ